ncbi:DUF397 domain-containing protein [Pseudonocardia humida]|uniref:DUF397 domain-containing protein n=1 Tax=Pseudonocardia humida TaxID=2800819 RepID=A0ABT1A2N6_9PSEU|nr:DUF397 domain-containing protein [Pseudonocardia humida]MCO1657271.1 DUF397 domain-containing protein [Pseudonocardia humida]
MPDADLQWTKSTASIGNGACVEFATHDGEVLVRNSRCPEIVISCTPQEMAAFFEGVRRHEFDDLLAP